MGCSSRGSCTPGDPGPSWDRSEGVGFVENRLAETDLVGRLGTFAAPLMNWATDERNQAARRTLESVAGIHHGARLPKQAAETFEQLAHRAPVEINKAVSINLGNGATVCFDTEMCKLALGWTGGFVKLPTGREAPRVSASDSALRSMAWLAASRTRRSAHGDFGSH